MENQATTESLLAAYAVLGFRARARVGVYEGTHEAFVITLERRQKKQCVARAERNATVSMTGAGDVPVILGAVDEKSIWTSRCDA